jgi:restriction system protein
MPKYHELLWPTLDAVRQLGGSATVEEINGHVIQSMRLSEVQQEVLHGDGPQTEIEYRLAWARTNLKWIELLENSARGVWSLTEKAANVTRADVLRIDKERRRRAAAERKHAETKGVDDLEVDAPTELTWKEQLLGKLLGLSPSGFERLTQRLLRESGFVNVTVTGRAGDGGIDGIGVYRPTLVSFPVYFQCKRYKGSVGPDKVRDFRGAMEGRGEKGLLITTGTFTREAQTEATRDGARPVELIDGERLCDLLRELELGVTVTEHKTYEIAVVDSFFSEFMESRGLVGSADSTATAPRLS